MRRILVALDRTAASSAVLSRAVEVARSSGAKLRLMRAVTVPPAPPPTVLVERTEAAGRASVVAAAEASLRELESVVPADLRDGVVVELGGAPSAICAAAKAYDADVVIMGARRRGALRRALESSTASKVLDRIDRPVLVVHVGNGPRRGRARRPAASGYAKDHADHPLLEATTLAGTATGAVVGSIGGLPGALAGSFIGTAVGMLAGAALDDESRRASRHDRELDERIGVTGPDLGAREAASTAETAREKAIASGAEVAAPDESTRAADVLRGEHEHLERVYADFLAAYAEGDWADVRAQWDVFEPALLAHMDLEEEVLLPTFRAIDPREAGAIVREHDDLRALLGTLSVLVDLHAVPARDAEELVARLQAHAVRERLFLYPWLDEERRPAPRRATQATSSEARR
jgi:nucleotide-binding universal stress UspA family protein